MGARLHNPRSLKATREHLSSTISAVMGAPGAALAYFLTAIFFSRSGNCFLVFSTFGTATPWI
jgi:hypothetical protein